VPLDDFIMKYCREWVSMSVVLTCVTIVAIIYIPVL